MRGETADQDHEGEGEGYLVSVSDLMVGLLFVFIMILVAFALLLREADRVSVSTDATLPAPPTAEEFQNMHDKAQRLEVGMAEAAQKSAKDEAERKTLAMELGAATVRLTAALSDLKDAQRQGIALAERLIAVEAEAIRLKAQLAANIEPLPPLPSLPPSDATNDEVSRGLRICQDQRGGLLRDIRSHLRQRNVEDASIDEATGVLRLSEKALYFAPRADSLPATGVQRDVVKAVADVLSEVLPCFTSSGRATRSCTPETQPIIDAVFVEGHTDRRPFRLTPDGKDENYGLSARRALNVYELMKRDQPILWDLRNRENFAIMGMSGYGPERPVPGRSGDNQEDWAANRRIEFRFLLDPLPCLRLALPGR
jgi:chemotaxis protein MotB